MSDGSASLNQLTSATFQAVRTLSCSPCPPTAPFVGLSDLVEACTTFCHEHLHHSLNEEVNALGTAVAEVAAGPSPISDSVEAEISRYSLQQEGPWKGAAGAAIVVRPDLVEPTVEFLRTAELVADVRTPSEVLREHHEGLIICGSLSLAFASPWLTQQEAVRLYGWIFTAPPSSEVILVEPDICRIDLDSVWLLGPGNHQALFVERVAISSPQAQFVPLTLPSVTPKGVTSSDFSFSAEQKRPAMQVLLASGHSVYFSNDEGPRPRRVVVSETGVDTEARLDPLDLHVNDLVLVRISGSDHDEIVQRADSFLTDEGWSLAKITEVRALVKLLKDKMREVDRAPGEAQRRMMASGLSEGYARAVTRNLLDEWYIAPHSERFEQVARAIGATEVLGRQEELSRLRTAHRQGGKDIARDLDALLSEESRWYDQLVTDGFALVHGGRLGDLLVEVVLCPAEDGYQVPASYLGRAVDGNPPQPVSIPMLRSNR